MQGRFCLILEYNMKLNDFFAAHPKVAIAFSGGADSAYLLYAAKQYNAEAQAYYVKSAFQPQFELDDALRLSNELNIPMRILTVDVLSSMVIAENPSDIAVLSATLRTRTAAPGVHLPAPNMTRFITNAAASEPTS